MDKEKLLLNFEELPFWLEHRGEINLFKKAINSPHTLAGEKIIKDSMNFPGFRAYPRAREIYGCLISLIEYEEAARLTGKELFSNPVNQKMALKSLSIITEDILKTEYNPVYDQGKSFSDYQNFLNSFTASLKSLEEKLSNQKPLDFVEDIFSLFSKSCLQLRGIISIKIYSENTRKQVRAYLAGYPNKEELLSLFLDPVSFLFSSLS